MKYSDEYYMRKAIACAKKGEGRTSPNPPVGAVLVKRGKVIAEGYHHKAGFPHAEVEAIRNGGRKVSGATLYVTLEPCSSFGRTPPCTDLIIASGIKKVIVARRDPDPRHRGKGISLLREAGIRVVTGVLEAEATELIKVFATYIRRRTPFVTAKVAQSLDGKIATATGESRWITGPDSRRFVHKLRSIADAIVVGANTIVSDDPLLTNRLYRPLDRQPIRVVLDSRLKISPESKIFSTPSGGNVIMATTDAASRRRRRMFEEKGATVLVLKKRNDAVSLKDLLKRLAERGIAHILVEGGGETLGSFFKEDLVDKAFFFMSPKIIGGEMAPTSVRGEGVSKLHLAPRLKDVTIRRFKEDILLEGNLK